MLNNIFHPLLIFIMKYFSFRLLFFILLMISNLTLATEGFIKDEPRIIGGSRSPSGAWPWVAHLYIYDEEIDETFLCGASLIDKDWLLTAAHCVDKIPAANITGALNRQNRFSSKGESFTIDRVVVHPDYISDDTSTKRHDYDIAILKLKSSSKIQPILLSSPYAKLDKAGRKAIALGWGRTDSGKLSRYLRQTDLPLISNKLCSDSISDNEGIDNPPEITNRMLCAGDGLGKKDTCGGDSGGPLITYHAWSQSWSHVGTTSWGYGCAEPNLYGVYTRTAKFTQLISDYICSDKETPAIPSLNPIMVHDDASATATATWNSVSGATGYRLHWWVNKDPKPEDTDSVNVNLNTTFTSGPLSSGMAFYVAVSSYNNNCVSQLSPAKYFSIP